MAVYGVKLIGRSLPRAYRDGEDIAARTDLCTAALSGGLAFLKGLGLGHALTLCWAPTTICPTVGRPFVGSFALSGPIGRPARTPSPIWLRC